MTSLLKTKRTSSKKPSRGSALSSKENFKNSRLSPESRALLKRFQTRLAEEQLLPRGSKVLLAVSGGGDSMALLSLLARLATKKEWVLGIAHVNYHLRGKDSERDEALVKNTAHALALPFFLLSSKKFPKANLEAYLRKLRYAFFEKIQVEKKYDVIVTAHTMNDVAETVLMNLLRGAGPRGLSPFQRQRQKIIRPLLNFSHAELLEFLKREKIPFCFDKSNVDPRFTRNRIRHTLIPFLQKNFNPQIIPSLTRMAEALESSTAATYPLIIRRDHTYSFSRVMFLQLMESQAFSFLSQFFSTVLEHSPSKRFLGEVYKTIKSTKNKPKNIITRDLRIVVFHARVETTLLG